MLFAGIYFVSSHDCHHFFLKIEMHGHIPAFSWAKTGCPKICAAALEVLHPMKLLSQNMHTAFLAPPFLALVLFVTAKYSQTKCATSLFSGCSKFALSMSSSVITWKKIEIVINKNQNQTIQTEPEYGLEPYPRIPKCALFPLHYT